MYFLATSAIERFWDKNKPILFLNEGCCRFSKRGINAKIDFSIVPSIWRDKDNVGQCLTQVEQIYLKVLSEIAPILNNLHGVNYSTRYWEIVVGGWLYSYIITLYDRFYTIVRAFDMDASLDSIVLQNDCYVVPNDNKDFRNYLVNDFYNLLICSQIIEFLGHDFPAKKLVYQNEAGQQNTDISNVQHMTRKRTDSLVMNMSYFSEMYELMIKNRANIPIDIYWEREISLPVFPIDKQMRDNIQLKINSSDKFEQFIINSISSNMPACYLEGYDYVKGITYNHPLYSTMPRGILSAVSFDADEVFKQWAAACSEEGTKIIGVAHSIAHPEYNSWEEHMKRISDKFYVPGLIRDNEKNVKILPSPKFCGRMEICSSEEFRDILFISTNMPRFFGGTIFLLASLNSEDYFTNQKDFWENLSTTCKDNFKVRLYIKDSGQDCAERWKSFAPEINLEKWEIPLSKRLAQSKVVICDNFQTTFSEAMAFNKPVLLYWDYKTYSEYLHPEAVKCFEELQSVGILHADPVSASHLLNQVYDNIETWWNEPMRQEVRKSACRLFIGDTQGAIDKWVQELNGVFDDLRPSQDIMNLSDYFKRMPGKKIALLGVNEVSDYLIKLIEKDTNKNIVGIIDDNEARFGNSLLDVEINSLAAVMSRQPDAIIISILYDAKNIEEQLKQYIPITTQNINLARDLPEKAFRELLINVYGEDCWRLVVKNG